MSMIKFILKRLITLIPVLFLVLTVTFILSKMTPGDPVLPFLPPAPTDAMIAAKYRELGLDKPIIIQYFIYLGNLFSGNWGYSIRYDPGNPVWALIWSRFPRTLDIALISMVLASIIGIKLGKISAKHRNKPKDTIVRFIALIGVAVPVFWMGLMLRYIFAIQLDILAGTGFKSYFLGDPPFITGFRIIDSFISGKLYYIGDYLYHLILPVICLTFISLAGITRQNRSSMLEVLEQDYIRTARAKGCKERQVLKTHAQKNALIPTITVIGINFAGLMSGAMLTEATFNLKGVGELLFSSITHQDYYLINAIVFVTTLLFIIANLIIDLIYGMIDPRIRY